MSPHALRGRGSAGLLGTVVLAGTVELRVIMVNHRVAGKRGKAGWMEMLVKHRVAGERGKARWMEMSSEFMFVRRLFVVRHRQLTRPRPP